MKITHFFLLNALFVVIYSNACAMEPSKKQKIEQKEAVVEDKISDTDEISDADLKQLSNFETAYEFLGSHPKLENKKLFRFFFEKTPQKTDKNGNTFVHRAALENNFEYAKRFIHMGLPFDTYNTKGESPISLARKLASLSNFTKNSDVLHLLQANYILFDELRSQADHSHVYLPGTYKCIAQQLLKGADINARMSNWYNNTPLLLITEDYLCDAKEKLVKQLLDAGALVDVHNSKGTTPLHKAAIYKSLKIAQLLLKAGALINDTTPYGNTPLHSAVYGESASYLIPCEGRCSLKEMIQFLLDHRADKTIRNDEDKTAQDVAREMGHTEIAEMIEQYQSQ